MIILTKENLRWESAVSTSHVLFLSFFVCVNLCVCNHCCSAAYSLVMMWKAHWTEHIVWIKAPKHVSVTVAEVNSEYVMQAFPCPDKHVSSLTPERVTSVDACWCRLTLHLSSLDNSVSCCSGDPLTFFPAHSCEWELSSAIKTIHVKIMRSFCSTFLHRLSKWLFDCW